MLKIRNILRSIRIEEYILFIFSLVLFLAYFIFTGLRQSHLGFFENGFKNVALGVRYFSFVFLFVYFYIFYKLYLYIINWLFPIIEKKISFKDAVFSSNPFANSWSKIKRVLLNSLVILRPVVSVTIFFTFITLMLGLLAVRFKEGLVDDLLMKLDNAIFNSYPFLWSYEQIAFFENLFAPLITYSYICLGSILGIIFVILYLNKNREFFNQYILAIVIAVMIALPFWFFLPAITPQNHYIDNIYNQEIDPHLVKLIENYQPNKHVLNFQEEIRLESNQVGDISAIPSMHASWAMIIVYYLYKSRKKVLFIFSLLWAFFSTWGTFYLAQHYFIDILVSLPVAFFAIFAANVLVKMEKKYYQNDRFDKYEEKMKIQVRDDLLKVPNMFKYFYSIFHSGRK